MRNIYIDLGSHDGDTLRLFAEMYPDAASYKAYCFEPNKMFVPNYRDLDCEHVQAAAWTRDGEIRFYTAEKSIGNTVMPNKRGRNKIDKTKTDTVPCVDFSAWLGRNVTPEDLVVCKVDIEGAEYDVLEKVVRDGNLDLIKKLYVEWHNRKLEGFDDSRHDRLVEALASHGSYDPEKVFCGCKKILDV
jgi:FkbM family methyltransferase